MDIKLNFPENNGHISNLAFIRALLIKCTIERLDVTYEEKEKIKKEILEYLKDS